MMYRFISALLVIVWAVAPASADLFTPTFSTNWDDMGNWSSNMVPGPTNTAEINSNSTAMMTGKGLVTPYQFKDLTISDTAILTITNSIVALSGNVTLNDMGGLALVESSLTGVDFIDPSFGGNGLYLNPSHVGFSGTATFDNRDFIFGLGGTTPAAPGTTGTGKYATFVANTLTLDGNLSVELFYSFMPAAGDTFQILTATTSRMGTFDNAAEGDIVAVFGSIGLQITYTGGSGNDVVLSAVAVPEPGRLICASMLLGSLGMAVIKPFNRRQRTRST